MDAPPIDSDLLRGLSNRPRSLPYRLLWDEYNTALYDEIRKQPEYYLNRVETQLLNLHAAEIVAATGVKGLLEFGPGTGEKALIVLRQMPKPVWFVPMDISSAALAALGERLAHDFCRIHICPICADFSEPWSFDQERVPFPLLAAILGGTFGNFLPEERHHFLANVAGGLRTGDTFLIGVPLIAGVDEMRTAYNDKAGLMVKFYRHCLHILNRDWSMDFDECAFDHDVRWSGIEQRVEIGLRATTTQYVHVPGIGSPLIFQPNEVLRAVVAARFTKVQVFGELAMHGFESMLWFEEPEHRYAIALMRKISPHKLLGVGCHAS